MIAGSHPVQDIKCSPAERRLVLGVALHQITWDGPNSFLPVYFGPFGSDSIAWPRNGENVKFQCRRCDTITFPQLAQEGGQLAVGQSGMIAHLVNLGRSWK